MESCTCQEKVTVVKEACSSSRNCDCFVIWIDSAAGSTTDMPSYPPAAYTLFSLCIRSGHFSFCNIPQQQTVTVQQDTLTY